MFSVFRIPVNKILPIQANYLQLAEIESFTSVDSGATQKIRLPS